MQTDQFNMLLILLVAGATAVISFVIVFITNIAFAPIKRQRTHNKAASTPETVYAMDLFAAQAEIREAMQKNISREIHDNIGLSLALSKLYLNTVPWEEPLEAKEKVTSAVEVLSAAINDLSVLANNLAEDVMIGQGLQKAVKEQLDHFRRVRLFTVDYKVTGEGIYMPWEKEVLIFRVMQECFTNIIRHANARQVVVRMDYEAKELAIRVEDNGRGFDMENGSITQGGGLYNIQKRVALLGGKVQVTSAPGKGTIIHLTIPI